VNYFELYPGDYLRDTAHLSLAEHGAYLLLLSAYYAEERPLPAGYDSLDRIARAMTSPEKKSVRAVADRYFPIGDDGLRHNDRADAEIQKAGHRMAATPLRKASQAERQRRARDRRKGLFEQLRAAGITPPFNSTTSDLEQLVTQHVTRDKSQMTKNVTRDITATRPQTPDPIEQEHDPIGSSAPATAAAPPIPYQAIVDGYNATLSRLAKVRDLTPKRRTLIRTAWQASPQRRSLAFWLAYFAECQDDDFLSGVGPYREPHANWRPDFDYLLKTDVVTRTFERAMDRMERAA
jgi:uncharacterized protein YdaU (DUF1376 family)